MSNLWVTTEDNPFDPFTQMDRWINYDTAQGYFTCAKLARLSRYSTRNLSDGENSQAIEDACRDLLRNHPFTLSRDGKRMVQYLPAVRGKTVAWK